MAMSSVTMRLLLVNVCLLSLATIIHGSGSLTSPTATPVSARSTDYLATADHSKKFLDLMKKHFDLSMEYLFTSKQYGSQYVQRPGMAKYLSEESERQWEEGMDLMKKFLQRGGSISNPNFKPAFAIEGRPELNVAATDLNNKYVTTLKNMLEDCKAVTTTMNQLHHFGARTLDRGGDAEIAHFFDNKLEKEAELTRELAGHVNTLQKMNNMGVAVKMFDSNL